MTEPKYLYRSNEDYHEFNLSFCGRLIKSFKAYYFKKNSKYPARIYAKAYFPPGCPQHLWMYYLVTMVNGKPHEITSITNEAFDTLTRGIEPECYPSVEYYTIEEHEPLKASEAEA